MAQDAEQVLDSAEGLASKPSASSLSGLKACLPAFSPALFQ